MFLHVVQDLNDGEFRYVTADIFDTDDDAKLIEHWDIIDELDGVGADGRSQVEGPKEPTDLERTDANKDVVVRFVDEILIPGHYERVADVVASDVAQHSRGVGDGIDAWQAFAADASLRCLGRHKVVGSGDFVAVLAESERYGTPHAVIDLYRVADGLIVEHWDVVEEITPKDTWVNSGKF